MLLGTPSLKKLRYNFTYIVAHALYSYARKPVESQSQEKSILFQTSLHTSTSQWNGGAHILNHLPNVGALAT